MAEIIDAYCTLGTERETVLSADNLLCLMDAAEIARAVIAPEDREIAVANTAGNRRIAEAALGRSDRFVAACSVNPWFGERACEELRRAVGEGARMLVLAPALQGFILSDEVADPVFEEAGRLGVAVYVHSGPHSSAAPSQLLLAVARHPSVRFIMGHCGSTDYHASMRAVLEAAENVWFELSLVRPWSAAQYARLTDGARLIFGSSAPRNDPAHELGHFSRYLPPRDYPEIYAGNITRLLEEAGS